MERQQVFIESLIELEQLFVESASAYIDFLGSFDKSVYGNLSLADTMTDYELCFEPYISLAKELGMTRFSLRQSTTTKRLYLWNFNIGGHGARFELRPVLLEHVLDIPLMRDLHQNHALLLGRNIDLDTHYEI